MSTVKAEMLKPLTRKDFQSSQEVRWCPGCGDYAILAALQRTLAGLDTPREQHVVVGGIGCSSRLPYYMDTYGLHGIHGRAPAIATGIRIVRPDLKVWVITGDGDALSIGGNHLLHALRRNVDMNILLFNNRVYGLTKGQYSPTSELGARSKSTPLGSVDHPLHPLQVALAAGATFIARAVDTDSAHLQEVLARAAGHPGTSFVEIYQNCPIFNDGVFQALGDRKLRDANALFLEDGHRMVFGAEHEHGIALGGDLRPRVVSADAPGVLVHDETNPFVCQIVTRIEGPDLPVPVGVLRAVERPTYEAMLNEQVATARSKHARGLQSLLDGETTWTVEPVTVE